MALLTSFLSACGGGSSPAPVSPPPPPGGPPPATNSPPTISGAPARSVHAGESYFFQPAAQDADNDPLTWIIANQPDWTDFDSATGALTGVPDESDVGSLSSIVITVSDGTASVSLPAFSISVEPQLPATAPSGLDTRPANSSCVAVAPPKESGIAAQRVFRNLSLANITAVTQPPGDSASWFFSTRDGLIGRFDNTNNVSSFTTVLDHTSRVEVVADGGMVQLVFHPDFPIDRRVFVNYSTPPADGTSVADVLVSSFVVSASGLTIDSQSETVVLRQPRGRFHQGGFMAFDEDGLLYVGFGDGGRQGDPDGHAQNLLDMRGKIIRIDVDSATPFAIPSDNPYAAGNGNPLPQIFASGVRNPYRGDIDPQTGDIYVADIGRNELEEVSLIESGSNLGWNLKEGTLCVAQQPGDCNDPALVDPLIEYDHSRGNCSIIGGYFYRGQELPQLQGRFIFGDFCSSKISAVDFDNNGQAVELPLIPRGSGIGNILSFAKDNDGELYAVTESQIFRIQAENPNQGSGPAAQLSQTGCFDPLDATVPAAGLIPYEINAPLWSDGASKRRWIAIPGGESIDVAADGDFLFPDGTVLVKEFSVDDAPVETRLFMKDDSGAWRGYSYEWLGDDAFLLQSSKDKVLASGLSWHFPDSGECQRCHTNAANFALGPEIGQLNSLAVYEQTNRVSNQLATLQHIGLLTTALPDTPDQLPALVAIEDTHQSLSRRARSYLHSNCAGCHRGEGITQSDMDLRFATARMAMNVCDADPQLGNLGIAGAKLLDPGNPENSVLFLRPSSADPQVRMPPLATSVVHDAAMAVLSGWINSTSICVTGTDGDQDRVPDDADNCPAVANPDQADVNKNQVGDVCESI